jgi:hypothetical protein
MIAIDYGAMLPNAPSDPMAKGIGSLIFMVSGRILLAGRNTGKFDRQSEAAITFS